MPCSHPHAPPVHLQNPFLLFICKWKILCFAVLSDISATPDQRITSCLLYYPILLQNSQILPNSHHTSHPNLWTQNTLFRIWNGIDLEHHWISKYTTVHSLLMILQYHCCPPLRQFLTHQKVCLDWYRAHLLPYLATGVNYLITGNTLVCYNLPHTKEREFFIPLSNICVKVLYNTEVKFTGWDFFKQKIC